ncbi:helix-turn-helix domain-containing protein [Paraferrimonas sedimenticola]|uniref:HTH araC/xylS-type domain-containing protein n=1 Tax=Paraferrimonas sedimenticola TaxID=375674 RepID=A0AA37RWK1_9GAMM|nr:helix-turn-helix domain-containing protein [Paraferrimonas sedimenticola]GLP96047.1 hypothetical protein GCM10007895_13530 [Paraferrimonas sedimenticola]
MYKKQRFTERSELAEYFNQAYDGQFDIIQLSPGPLECLCEQLILEQIQLYWTSIYHPVMWSFQPNRADLRMNLVLSQTDEFTLWGNAFDEQTIVIQGNKDTTEGYQNGVTQHLQLVLSEELAGSIGLPTDRNFCLRGLAIEQVQRLVAICDCAKLQLESFQNSDSDLLEQLAAYWNQAIAVELTETFSQVLEDPDVTIDELAPTKPFATVQELQKLFGTTLHEESIQVADLAEQIGVSERTVYNAFKDSFGVGPRQIIELLRLYEFRKRLLEAEAERQTVTEIAFDLGLFEIGRIAQRYKKQFGELPNETLKRA